MKFSVFLFALLFISFFAYADDPPPGGIHLLEGYRHTKMMGEDTPGGQIRNDRIVINYEAGGGVFAAADWPSRTEWKWSIVQKRGDREITIFVNHENDLYISFRATKTRAAANFAASVQSPQDVAEVLLMVLTYDDEPQHPSTQPTIKP
jgi:hypothetical protein